jgi:hypothetical protein
LPDWLTFLAISLIEARTMDSDDLRTLAELHDFDLILRHEFVAWLRVPLGTNWHFYSGLGYWSYLWNKYFARILKQSSKFVINANYDTIFHDQLGELMWKTPSKTLKLPMHCCFNRFDWMSPWLQAIYCENIAYLISDFIFVEINKDLAEPQLKGSIQMHVDNGIRLLSVSEGVLLARSGHSRLYALPWFSKLFIDKPTALDVKRYLRRLLQWIHERKQKPTAEPIPATVVLFEPQKGSIHLLYREQPGVEAKAIPQIFAGQGEESGQIFEFLNLKNSQTWQKWD